ncbi:hypothetical protein AQUCO_03600078v1 [Aquilegia coerulea]|uniref:KIB1-4 beta-propeller domain-containing protein n=1 Tax=Aquilegia coerulea TaxID=218851 RepID=A0A2G5CV81_AQUCA|nr:hypothetical protein AQUCO_03600078v1 [Aquilegia coerulea]
MLKKRVTASNDSYEISNLYTDYRMRTSLDWLELPDHVLSLIATKLVINIKDYIYFGSVCRAWRSVYTGYPHPLPPPQPPLLLLATELNQDDQTRSFYSLAEERVLNFRVPVPHDRHCRGSSHGWLVTVHNDWEITLFNPFLADNNEIQLPSATTFEPHGDALTFKGYMAFVGKVILSANPVSDPNYIAMAIYSDFSRVAFFKPGDTVWTSLDSDFTLISDIVYYKDQFYFVNSSGMVFACDLNHPHPRVSTVAPPLKSRGVMRYLVESSGELLQVCRHTKYENSYDDDDVDEYRRHFYINEGFDVFKLDLASFKWIKMETLHGRTLFLGDNSSYSLSASDFPECKPNSIYFTDDYYEGYFGTEQYGIGPHDIGVFDLEKRTVEPHYSTDMKMFIPAPVWIEPTL